MGVMKFAPETLKNLFKKPVTTGYPAVPAVYPERSRGHVEITIDECIGCGMCVRCCPCGTLKVDKIEGTWSIDRFDCIACGYCVEKCPKKCLHMIQGYQHPGPEKNSVIYKKSQEVLEAEAKKREEMAKKAAEAKKLAEAKKAEEAKSSRPKGDDAKADDVKGDDAE